MPLVLSNRNARISEQMDLPDCDLNRLKNTYEQFKTINSLLSGWTGIYRKWIRPVIASRHGKATLLDIGSGGGDVLHHLHQQTLGDGFDVKFTGIDPDARATNFAQKKFANEFINFRKMTSGELIETGSRFDFVISNHLLHHLPENEFGNFFADAATLSKRLVLFNDIERSDLGYASFRMAAPMLFSNSYIVEDGLTSIKRSYTRNELRKKIPAGWIIKKKFPFRLLVIYQTTADA